MRAAIRAATRSAAAGEATAASSAAGRRWSVSRRGQGSPSPNGLGTYTIDFTQEGRRKVNLFSYVLGYSRRQYLHFTDSQDLETTLREHVRAFEHLGGVAATCLYDNMKVVVARYEGERADLQHPLPGLRHALRLPAGGLSSAAAADERQSGAAILLCRDELAQRPRVPLLGASQRSDRLVAGGSGRRARPPADASGGPSTCTPRNCPHLIPLPERPYEVAEVVYRTVDAEGMVPYGQNRYSVPWHYIGQVLPVRITDEAVTIYGPRLELAGPARAVPADRAAPAEPAARTPSAPRPAAAARGAARAVRGVGCRWPCGSWRACWLPNAMAGTRPRRCSPCWAPIAATICWPPWSVPCVTARSRRSPWNASWRCRPDPRPAGTAWRKKNRLTWGNCCPTTPRRRGPPRNTNTCCSRSPTTMTTPKKKTTPARKTRRRTFKRTFVNGSWTTWQTLKVPLSAETLDAALARADQEGLSHLNFLELIFGEPAARSRQRAIERRIREAKFREDKNLADFDWKFNAAAIDRAQIEQLATGEFVRRSENLVMVGQSGVGKSHLLQALGKRFCELGYRVRYTTSAELVGGPAGVAGRPDLGRAASATGRVSTWWSSTSSASTASNAASAPRRPTSSTR